jgi:polyhydroxybutyrate depolymerase
MAAPALSGNTRRTSTHTRGGGGSTRRVRRARLGLMNRGRLAFAVLWCAVVVSGCSGVHRLRTDDGRVRTFLVHRPEGVTGPLPIVLVLHGGGGNGAQTKKSLSFDRLADEHGFLAVYPDGTGRTVLGKLFGTWNSDEECCGSALAEGVDDVAFIDQLLDELGARHDGDVDHVFVTGLSNGGDMAHRLGCELADRVDAIAPVGAPRVVTPCHPSRPVPTMIVHGTDDPCALYDGGERCGGCFSQALQDLGVGNDDAGDHFSCRAAPDVAADWRARNGCADTGSQITFENGDASCETWRTGCDEAEVTLCTIVGGGHSYPGATRACDPGSRVCDAVARATGPVSDDMDAAPEIWKFFAAHR